MTFAGKSALITGSLGGIGFATAKALARDGADITLNGFAGADVIDARLIEQGQRKGGRT
jgi:3-hydroxybutyrate dehydrogenase